MSIENFEYKGKQYMFKVGGITPKLEPFEVFDSNYYKEKEKTLNWVGFTILFPFVILGILFFVYVDSESPEKIIEWIAMLGMPYLLLMYAAFKKLEEFADTAKKLREYAEHREYIEAHRVWSAGRQNTKNERMY